MDSKISLNIENNTDNNLNNLNNLNYLNPENNENIENLTGDELNKKLEEILTTPVDEETIIKIKEKAYKAYLKQLAANCEYRRKHREKN